MLIASTGKVLLCLFVNYRKNFSWDKQIHKNKRVKILSTGNFNIEKLVWLMIWSAEQTPKNSEWKFQKIPAQPRIKKHYTTSL